MEGVFGEGETSGEDAAEEKQEGFRGRKSGGYRGWGELQGALAIPPLDGATPLFFSMKRIRGLWSDGLL